VEAEEWVMDLERAAGRSPERIHAHQAGDISSPPRTIEVKLVRSGKYAAPYFRLSESEVATAQQDPSFYLYVVEERDEESPDRFSLRVFGGLLLRRLIAAARRRTWYEIPIRSEEYRNAPGLDALSGNDSPNT
jgi:hypothetical protein